MNLHKVEKLFAYWNIYIFIAIAWDKAVILVAVHFSMKNIVTLCNHGRAKGRANDNVIQ